LDWASEKVKAPKMAVFGALPNGTDRLLGAAVYVASPCGVSVIARSKPSANVTKQSQAKKKKSKTKRSSMFGFSRAALEY
jgi:hypothetical protein